MDNRRSIMFVCERNVCRSPLMEATFRTRMPGDAWVVSSAGTRAADGVAMCETSRGVTAAAGVAAGEHRSRAATAEILRAQDLIIAASRAERSLLARIEPMSRQRTFTLREALHLARAPFTRPELAIIDDGGDGLSRVLNSRRGMSAPPAVPSGFLSWLRPAPNPFDVVDVHGESRSRHQAGLTTLVQETSQFASIVQKTTLGRVMGSAEQS